MREPQLEFMIEIKELPDGNPFIISTVTDFCDSMGYCEYKIKHFLEGVRAPQTEMTIEGTKAHEKQEQYEKEHFELVPISQEELADIKKDVEFAYESIRTRLLVPVNLGKEKLQMLVFGRADKVYRSKGTLIVEESKFPWNKQKYLETYEPYPDHKLQTLLYLNSYFTESGSFEPEDWFTIPHKKKAWVINIKDRNNGETIKIFKGNQTKATEKFLNDNLQRFAQIVLGKIEPCHHKELSKCQKCGFRNCVYQLSS